MEDYICANLLVGTLVCGSVSSQLIHYGIGYKQSWLVP